MEIIDTGSIDGKSEVGIVIMTKSTDHDTTVSISKKSTFLLLKNKSKLPIREVQPVDHKDVSVTINNEEIPILASIKGTTMHYSMKQGPQVVLYRAPADYPKRIGKFAVYKDGGFFYALIGIDENINLEYHLKPGISTRFALIFDANIKDVDGFELMGKFVKINTYH